MIITNLIYSIIENSLADYIFKGLEERREGYHYKRFKEELYLAIDDFCKSHACKYIDSGAFYNYVKYSKVFEEIVSRATSGTELSNNSFYKNEINKAKEYAIADNEDFSVNEELLLKDLFDLSSRKVTQYYYSNLSMNQKFLFSKLIDLENLLKEIHEMNDKNPFSNQNNQSDWIDLPNIYGKITKYKKDGSIYVGGIENDRPSGFGKLIYPSGQEYEGMWKAGVWNGQGKLTTTSGHILICNFNYGVSYGEGKIISPNGDIFIGEIQDDKPYRYGKMVFVNPFEVVECELDEKGEFDGQGLWFSIDGNLYIGNIKDKYPHGKGKMFYKSGDIYEGNWDKGSKEGNGKEIYSDGVIYEGEWSNGDWVEGDLVSKRSTDKYIYIGKVVDGLCQGNGIECLSAGDVVLGFWDKGELHHGNRYSPDGRIYMGTYVKGMSHGKGKMIWPDGEMYVGDWERGVPQGHGKWFYKTDKISEGEWDKGELVKKTEGE